MTVFAANVTIVLPLKIVFVPTESALEIIVLGMFVPFALTACVIVVASAAETLLLIFKVIRKTFTIINFYS